MRPVNPIQGYAPKEVQQAIVVSVPPPVMPAVVATTILDDGLRKDMREVVDLMKNLSLKLLGNAGANRGPRKPFNQATGDHS